MSPSSCNSDALDSLRSSLPRAIAPFMTAQLLEAYDKSKLGQKEKTVFALQLFVLKLPKDAAEDLIGRCRNIMAQDPQKNTACLKLIEVCEEVVHIASRFLPHGIEFSPTTRGLFEVFYKTKLGQMEETAFTRRLVVLDKLSPNIVENLTSQCRSIMDRDPMEKAACLQVIEACEQMVRIAKSPHVSCTNLLGFPLDIRNGIYDMVIGCPEILVHQCGNATQKYVTCPTGSCRAAPQGDICTKDLKEVLALAQTCQQVRAELLKVLYTKAVLYFSCTCALAVCLGKNQFVRNYVQSIRLHLRGGQTKTAIALLYSCPNLKYLELTVSRDTKIYHTEDDSKDRTSPRRPDGFIIRKLEEVRGVSGLLKLGGLETIQAKHAAGVVGVSPWELKGLNAFLKAGVAARRAELARGRDDEAAKSLNVEVDDVTTKLAKF